MKHISTKVKLIIIVAELIVMGILLAFLNKSLSEILKDWVIADMSIIAHHRSDLAENYIEGRCDFLNGYARASETDYLTGISNRRSGGR